MKIFARIRPLFYLGLTLAATAATSSNAEARELFGKVGVGYNAEFANTSLTNGVPAISVKYGIVPRSMIEIIGGFYSGNEGSGVFALKFMQTIQSVSYANLYFLLGGGWVEAEHRSGAEFLGGLGAEFFIPGVDMIGINFEAGMAAENITQASQTFVLKTFGASFINAGMHYYF